MTRRASLSLAARIGRAASRLVKRGRDSSPLQSWRANGLEFSQPRLLGVSKYGYRSWYALADGQPTKICEFSTEAHACFADAVMRLEDCRAHFPKVLLRQGVFLAVEWVQGRPLTAAQLQRDTGLAREIAGLQAKLHASDISAAAQHDPDSYAAFLLRRFARCSGLLPVQDALDRMQQALQGKPAGAEVRLAHPDVTMDNLIRDKASGSLKIVDNELLTRNSYHAFDLFNTCHSFDSQRTLLEAYVDGYAAHGGRLDDVRANPEFYDALWHLRIIGSHLQSGRIEAGIQLAQAYARSSCKEIPIIAMVRERG